MRKQARAVIAISVAMSNVLITIHRRSLDILSALIFPDRCVEQPSHTYRAMALLTNEQPRM
jgi:hypothetical protein